MIINTKSTICERKPFLKYSNYVQIHTYKFINFKTIIFYLFHQSHPHFHLHIYNYHYSDQDISQIHFKSNPY
jgi:hypothetical protein